MFKRIKRTSLILGITLTVILGMSYGTFIFTTNSYRSTEMLVGNLTYGIEITSTGGSETINGTSVSLTSGKTSTVLLKITSLNKIISKYGIDYKMSSGTGSVKYASNTGWLPTGKINENNVGTYEKIIKVVISATTDVTVDFTVTGGYSNNDLIEVKEGYTRLTEVYDGIVDYKEDLKTIISKETTNNIYGGEAINNYLQYPTNTDATKNIWRVLGYYNSVDGIKAVSNQASTTTQGNISSSLTSFYNTLEKQEDYVLETNKFNCTNTTCTTSNYSNIGLLSTSEYNMLGGVNSYLASSESYFGLDNTTIKNITSSGITDTTTSTTSGLRPAIYLQNDVKVTGSGTTSDPYRLSDKGDVIFASATLNGTALETFPKESDPYIPKTVTCTNGSVGHWNTEKQKIELTTVNLPTSCVVDFTEGYTVTLNATNGTVTAPASKVIGRTGTATFTVSANIGYNMNTATVNCDGDAIAELNTSTGIVDIENILKTQLCSVDNIMPNQYTLTLTKETGVSRIYYKINGASSYSSVTSTQSLSVNYGSTYYYYGVASTGYSIRTCTSSSPCSGTMGTSAVSKTLSATPNSYKLTLVLGSNVSEIYYKINGASEFTSTTSSQTLNVTYGTTYYYYGVTNTGFTMNGCTSSSPCSGTMGTSAVSKTLNAGKNYMDTSLATIIQENAINEDGYRYEGVDPVNYIYMIKDGVNEMWRIIGLFPDGENDEDVIRVRKVGYERAAYDSNSTNHWPKTTLYTTLSSTYSTTNYKNTVNYKMYLGTSEFNKYSTTVSGYYAIERGSIPGKTAQDSYSSATTFTGSVGLMYPSDYGYAVLASDCARTNSLGYYSGFGGNSCRDNNWLHNNDNDQWLITPNYSYVDYGIVLSQYASVDTYNGVGSGIGYQVTYLNYYSPVMALKSNVIVNGSGTKFDPYVMK